MASIRLTIDNITIRIVKQLAISDFISLHVGLHAYRVFPRS
jgi:hypothetical protein